MDTRTNGAQHANDPRRDATDTAEPGSVTQITSTDEHSPAEKSPYDWKDPLKDNWPMLLVGAGATVAAFITLAVIKQQTKAAMDSAELTRQSIVLANRPRLTIRNIVIEEPTVGDRFFIGRKHDRMFNPEKKFKGKLAIVNFGGHQATIQNSSCAVVSSGPPEELPRKFGAPDGGGVLIPNGAVIRTGERVEGRFGGNGPTEKQVNKAAVHSPTETLFLYIVGWIDYADELGHIRRTSFCRVYRPQLDRFIPVDDPDYESAD